jgi:hypothetical protein
VCAALCSKVRVQGQHKAIQAVETIAGGAANCVSGVTRPTRQWSKQGLWYTVLLSSLQNVSRWTEQFSFGSFQH